MTNRELSEKLDTMASKLEEFVGLSPAEMKRIATLLAAELRVLSNEKYTPNASWDAVRKQTTATGTKKTTYTNRAGRPTPF